MKIETYQKSPDNENSYSAIFDSIDLLIHIFFIMVIFIYYSNIHYGEAEASVPVPPVLSVTVPAAVSADESGVWVAPSVGVVAEASAGGVVVR